MCDEQAALALLFVLGHYVSALFPGDHSVVCRLLTQVASLDGSPRDRFDSQS